MKRWPSRQLLAGALAAPLILAALPAFGQDSPESILPPGFGEPVPPPPAPPPAVETPASASPSPAAPRPAPPSTPRPSDEGDDIGEGEEIELPPAPPPIEMPEEARRSPEIVGTLDEARGGFAASAFGDSHGKFLSALMRRTDAPLPSRWAQIGLRRLLLSRIPAPRGVDPVDWAAERAWMLLRMGEADGARLLVQGVDVADFTPKMYDVAVQAALATADPVALCPLVEGGAGLGNERIWPLARAMCSGLSGEGGLANAQINAARRARGGARGLDLLLAEKVVGAGSGTRGAVTIQWDGVDKLTAWRFGLANATAVPIPPALFATTGAQARAWQARAPLIAPAERLPYARSAASLGVLSSASLVQLYSLLADDLDVAEIRDSDPGRLQTAYIGRPDARLAALRRLWGIGGDDEAYSNLIMTAGAVARLQPGKAFAGDADKIVASLLSAGLDSQAARWSALVSDGDGAAADRAWALIALGAPSGSIDTSYGRVDGFSDGDTSADKLRSKLLVAGLAGLGRIDASARERLAETLGLSLGGENSWTRALDAAARGGQGGTVMLLAATGLQAGGWGGVPPRHLYRICRALTATGQDYAARMIAAEALSRT